MKALFAVYGFALGSLAAWAIVILLAYGRPELYTIEVFAATGLAGGAYGVVVGAAVGARPSRNESSSRFQRVLRFLKFAAAGWFGHVVVVGAAGAVARHEFAIENMQVFVFLIVFGAIGVTAGLASSRYQQTVVEREAAVRLARERQRAAEELELARQLQRQLLPPATMEGEGFTLQARIHPARYVAGDFYDYSVNAGKVSFCIADVAGKGAAAGLLMATTKAMLSMLRDLDAPAAVMKTLNEQLCERVTARQFVALLFGVFSPDTGRVVFANAGMPDPFRITRSGEIQALEATGERFPLGLRRNREYQHAEIFMAPGDRLACFSDGIPEAGPDDAEPLGYERLQAIFSDLAMLDDAQLADAIIAKANAFAQNDLSDDCTVLILTRRSYG